MRSLSAGRTPSPAKSPDALKTADGLGGKAQPLGVSADRAVIPGGTEHRQAAHPYPAQGLQSDEPNTGKGSCNDSLAKGLQAAQEASTR